MGPLTNRRITTILAGMMAGLIVALNIYLIYQTMLAG